MTISHSMFDKMPSPFAMQAISNVSTNAGVSSVVIQFNTLFVTVPIVEVSRVDRIAQQVPKPVMAQFPIFGGLREVHRIEFRELEPFTHYQFNIKASGGPDGGVGLAKSFGDFFTATRSGEVVFDNLQIVQEANQDMYFNIEAYDGGGNYDILSRFLSGHKFLDRGDYNQPFPDIALGFAPDSIRLSITGYNEDSPTLGLGGFEGFGHGAGPDTLPPPTAPDGNTYYDNDQAIFTGIIQTLELGQFSTPGLQTIPFVLSSINKRFGYDISGRIRYQVKDHPETLRRAHLAEAIRKLSTSTTTMMIGHAVGVGGKHGHSHIFALAPGDTAYRQVREARARDPSWKLVGENIAGPLMVLASDAGPIDLFAAEANGVLRHGHLQKPEDPEAKPVWKPLGDVVKSPVFAIRGDDGAAHVFGFDQSGAVRHIKIGPADRRSDWGTLGGTFRGSLSLVAEKDDFHVFVSDQGRGIFYQRWTPTDPATSDWLCLTGFKGPISTMRADDGSIFVVGYESGNPASYKVLTASEGWGREGWIMIDGPEPTDVLLTTTNGDSD
jgi:hypothetical protein